MRILLVFLLIGQLTSCAFLGEDAVQVPAYIYIDKYTFTTDFITQGDTSNQFVDMWIANKGVPLGAIGLPTLIPIQATGNTEIRVDAGIIKSGQNNERLNYPLTASHFETRNLVPGKIDTIRPEFKYLPTVEVAFVEDYDRVGTNFTIVEGDTVLPINDNRAWKPGTNSGKLVFAKDTARMLLFAGGLRDALGNYEGYELPPPGTPIFLEIDYNSNLNIDIGYIFKSPGSQDISRLQSVIQTFPTAGEWKKLYIDLTDEISAKQIGTRYIFYILVVNFNNTATPEVLLDNIKLVYIK